MCLNQRPFLVSPHLRESGFCFWNPESHWWLQVFVAVFPYPKFYVLVAQAGQHRIKECTPTNLPAPIFTPSEESGFCFWNSDSRVPMTKNVESRESNLGGIRWLESGIPFIRRKVCCTSKLLFLPFKRVAFSAFSLLPVCSYNYFHRRFIL